MLRARKPVRIQVPCAGLEPGSKVSIKIFEPHGLGGDPVDTLQATVSKDGGVAETTWTYDHAKYKDKVTAARFVLLIEGGGRTTISEPLEFVDLLEVD
ncbi:MAG: hypothetical protein ACAI25_00375, partial [Planctomycetota bacterium]